MCVGEDIIIKATTSDCATPEQRLVRVCQIYPKFVLLSTGQFKVYALIRDLEAGLPIRL